MFLFSPSISKKCRQVLNADDWVEAGIFCVRFTISFVSLGIPTMSLCGIVAVALSDFLSQATIAMTSRVLVRNKVKEGS